ncbi:SEC-C motif-containing protein [Halopolyspora algeriensis]|uniref:SEC-C motif-containing protein n=1 Tax=Halopolyspora algeriensis TaxID=1500506 RepID=A0A368W0Y4_9ACTN|nr:DUF5926 family protein [Halopolyspora algeriensis]RCW47292.1 SEC-C motif-containing protein [Halopolyspora algeriensis]TQM42527.1 SEC-C motif-containing protein [Halopolyspora algeriensis]
MAKRTVAEQPGTEGGTGRRQPCPCGSGKRYKACHGAAGGAANVIVSRPFAGLAAECELVALREFVPSATAKLSLRSGDRVVTLATVLPMAAAAMVRSDGQAFVGLQVQTRSGDVSRDLARAVEWAQQAEPGASLPAVGPEDAPEGTVPARLQDLVDPDALLDAELYDDFSWWMPDDVEPTGDVALSLERANAAIMPTRRLDAEGVHSAYWVDAGEKAHVRWVRPDPEEQLLAALARLSARGELALDADSRYAGSFRAHGLLVPVWDVDREKHAREWEQPAAAMGHRLEEVLTSLDSEPLDAAERRAREGLRGRQITVR